MIFFLSVLFSPLLCGEEVEFRGAKFTVYRIDPAKEKLEVFWRDKKGEPYLTFEALQAALKLRGKRLKFAVNAGIYAPGFSPEGLHVEEGKKLVSLNLKNAPGNFYLKPNGVFFIDRDGAAGVMESLRFKRSKQGVRLAVQSGPLLLDRGKVHHKFNEPSKNLLLRNGVGVDDRGRIVFACSDRSEHGKIGRINLYGFAMLFKKLGCESALFLDGDISEMFISGETGTLQRTSAFAAMFGIVEELKE
ncbi:MAG: phosphodiester glycosidase family protein [Verrucomicrobiota bacterium]